MSSTCHPERSDLCVSQAITTLVHNELTHHPRLRLIDVYKLLSQSAFGPGHLIHDKDSAKDFLKNEIASGKQYISKFDTLSTHPYITKIKSKYKYTRDNQFVCPCILIDCDIFVPFARYSLQLVVDKVIPFDAFFDAFIESADTAFVASEPDFLTSWDIAKSYLANYHLADYQKDCEMIDKMLSQRQYITSHSAFYAAEYSPCYRIINKNYLDKYETAIAEKYFV